MADEIKAYGLDPAATYYIVVTNAAGLYWNTVAAEFDAFVSGDWDDYDNGAVTPNAAGDWKGSFPVAITTPGSYSIQLRLRAAGTPLVTDDLKAGPNTIAWTGTAESAFSGGTGMTVETARAIVTAMVRDGSGESVVHLDYAIQLAGDHFCRTTRSVIRTDSVTITDASTSFPLTSPIASGFRPERIIDAWLTTEPNPLTIVDYHDLQVLAADDAGTGIPTRLAFLDNTSNGLLWKTPGAAYTARLRYWLPFTVWTPGATDGETLATVLNIPTDIIRPVLTLGAASVLKGPSPEAAFATESWRKFEEYEMQQMGGGNLGSRVTFRNPVRGRYATVGPYDQRFPGEQ